MDRVDRIKRQLVRQAVQDNLDLISGRRRSARPRARRWPLVWGVPALVVLSLGVLVSSYAFTGGIGAAVPRLAAHLEAVASPAGGAPEGGSAGLGPPADDGRGTADAGGAATTPPADAELSALLESARPVDPEVFPLAVRRVVIDPGHGGDSLGTRTPSGLMEKDITLDVSLRLTRLLRDGGLEVVMTRTDDSGVALRERARFANGAEADLFVSVHVNWIDDGGSRGVETYYLGTTDDPYLNRLAADENRDSGYSLADLRKLLDRIYSGVRQGKSRELAEAIQGSLYTSLKKVNPQLRDRGVKTAPFLVLVETEMPAVLAEVSCLSNRKEADLLTKPLYRQFIAEALARGIRAYADGFASGDGAVSGV